MGGGPQPALCPEAPSLPGRPATRSGRGLGKVRCTWSPLRARPRRSPLAPRAPRRPLSPPLTSASLAGLRGRGFLRGSVRPSASSTASSMTPRTSPARPGSRGIVSVPALLRAEPPRLRSHSRASVRAGPRLLQRRERADGGAAGGGGRGGDRRPRGRAGRGRRAALGSAPRNVPALPGGAAPRRARKVSAGQEALFDPAASPPPVPAAGAVAAPSEFLFGGRRGRRARRAPAARGHSCRGDPPGPRGRGARRSPARKPSGLGQMFVPRGRFARGRRPGSDSSRAPAAPQLEVEPGETPATVSPISSGCSQSTSNTQRDLRLRCEDRVPGAQQRDTFEGVVRRSCPATGCHLVLSWIKRRDHPLPLARRLCRDPHV